MINQTEFAVLVGVAQAIVDCTGGQFGYADEISGNVVANANNGTTLKKEQMSGYVSQLVQKGLIIKDSEFGALEMTELGQQEVKARGYFTNVEFEVI